MCVCVCFLISVPQIGSANPRLQNVLDALNSIKSKVSYPNQAYTCHYINVKHAFSSPKSMDALGMELGKLLTHYNLLSYHFLYAGQAEQFWKLWSKNPSSCFSGLLDLRWLPDHSPSAGECHLDCSERANQCQPCTGSYSICLLSIPSFHIFLFTIEFTVIVCYSYFMNKYYQLNLT